MVGYSSSTDSNDLYARGHNIPNADRNADNDMMRQTFCVTNSTPQIQNRFNSTIWNAVEEQVRTLAQATDTLYVVTGASFRKTNGSESIKYITPQLDTDKSVPVPNYYWKVLLKVSWSGRSVSSASAIGIWIPHGEYTKPSGGWNYSSYAMSVDQIEAWTGFDLFANLPGDNSSGIEKSAEANTSWQSFQSF